jgi:hypothetical protein
MRMKSLLAILRQEKKVLEEFVSRVHQKNVRKVSILSFYMFLNLIKIYK